MRTTSTRTRAAAVGLALVVALLATGCGGDDPEQASAPTTPAVDPVEAYCDVLQKNQTGIAAFAGGSPDFAKFPELVTKIGEVAAASTEDVVEDWKVIFDGVSELQESLTTAGTDLGAVVGSTVNGTLPDGVTAEEMTGIGTHLQALQGDGLKTAIAKISEFSEPACGVALAGAP